jgi:hypothetical protein
VPATVPLRRAKGGLARGQGLAGLFLETVRVLEDATLRQSADEMGPIRHVSEIDMRSDVTDPLRQIRCPIHRERQRVTLAHRDVDELEVALLAQIRTMPAVKL